MVVRRAPCEARMIAAAITGLVHVLLYVAMTIGLGAWLL
jgi:hypothetical protein